MDQKDIHVDPLLRNLHTQHQDRRPNFAMAGFVSPIEVASSVARVYPKKVLLVTASMSMDGSEWPSDVVITLALKRPHTTVELDQGADASSLLTYICHSMFASIECYRSTYP
jgi:hypothetical protein